MNIALICEQREKQRLFARSSDPQLPSSTTAYGRAKRLEFAGDLGGALMLYLQALRSGERTDSAMKDIAGLLNMLGRAKEAVEFLKANERYVVNYSGYRNLLERLEAEEIREKSGDMPRAVYVEVLKGGLGVGVEVISMALCDRLFPNPGKVLRILRLQGGLGEGGVEIVRGVVQFASHSAARKALFVRKLASDVIIDWARPRDELLLKRLEYHECEYPGKGAGSKVKITVDLLPEHLAAFADKTGIPIYDENHPDESLRELLSEVEAELTADADPCPTGGVSDCEEAGERIQVETPEHPLTTAHLEVNPMMPYVAELPALGEAQYGTAAIVFPISGFTVDQVPRDLEVLVDIVIASAHALRSALLMNRFSSAEEVPTSVAETPEKDDSSMPVLNEPSCFYTPSPLLDRLARLL